MESPKVTNWGELGVAAAEIAYDEPQVSVIVACADVCVKPPEKVVLTLKIITSSMSDDTRLKKDCGCRSFEMSFVSPVNDDPSSETISVV